MPKRRRDNRGSTLVEVLCATSIMGTAVVAVITCMGALMTSSGQNRQATTAGIVTRDYAEALQLAIAQTNSWCSASYTVAYTPPAGFAVTPTLGACPATTAGTPQFQTATITATSSNGVSETLKVVVRKP